MDVGGGNEAWTHWRLEGREGRVWEHLLTGKHTPLNGADPTFNTEDQLWLQRQILSACPGIVIHSADGPVPPPHQAMETPEPLRCDLYSVGHSHQQGRQIKGERKDRELVRASPPGSLLSGSLPQRQLQVCNSQMYLETLTAGGQSDSLTLKSSPKDSLCWDLVESVSTAALGPDSLRQQ